MKLCNSSGSQFSGPSKRGSYSAAEVCAGWTSPWRVSGKKGLHGSLRQVRGSWSSCQGRSSCCWTDNGGTEADSLSANFCDGSQSRTYSFDTRDHLQNIVSEVNGKCDGQEEIECTSSFTCIMSRILGWEDRAVSALGTTGSGVNSQSEFAR